MKEIEFWNLEKHWFELQIGEVESWLSPGDWKKEESKQWKKSTKWIEFQDEEVEKSLNPDDLEKEAKSTKKISEIMFHGAPDRRALGTGKTMTK